MRIQIQIQMHMDLGAVLPHLSLSMFHSQLSEIIQPAAAASEFIRRGAPIT